MIFKDCPEHLKEINFPYCVNNCALAEMLGISECENVECCMWKFKKEKNNETF